MGKANKGKRNVSLEDIARRLGVSKTLVSLVLNGKSEQYGISAETCRKVLEVARELHYRPNYLARGLRTGNTSTVGLIVSDISNSFYASIARKFEDLASASGYRVIIGSTDEDPRKEQNLIELLTGRRVDGLVISTSQNNPEELEKLYGSGYPLVLIDRYFKGSSLPAVVVDNSGGGGVLAHHLLHRGYTRPLVMALSTSEISSVRERVEGFCRAFSNSAHPPRVEPVDFSDIPGDVERIAARIKSGKLNVDSVFAVNNSIATALLDALRRSALSVPDDIALGCFDDLPYFTFIRPSVTAVSQPIDAICRQAFSLLLKQLQGGTLPEHFPLTLPVELQERESTVGR